jgi:hypothetical protein
VNVAISGLIYDVDYARQMATRSWPVPTVGPARRASATEAPVVGASAEHATSEEGTS